MAGLLPLSAPFGRDAEGRGEGGVAEMRNGSWADCVTVPGELL